MKNLNIMKLAGCIALPLITGCIIGYIIKDDISTWYAQLQRPVFDPPNWVFAPVWTLLYILMGISYYMILELKPGETRSKSLMIFYIQLALNFFWSLIFFSFHRPAAALFEIALLRASILLMIILFRRLKPVAAYLQAPYLLWVSFAALLNAGVWMMNRG
jgi:translocator protein